MLFQAVNVMPQTAHLPRLLCSLGMSLHDAPVPADMKSCYTVILDGRVIGRVDMDIAPSLVNRLRLMKVLGLEKVLIKLVSLEIRTAKCGSGRQDISPLPSVQLRQPFSPDH